MVKNPPAIWKTLVRFLGWDYSLEKGMATHSSILAWRIPWTEEPGRLQSMALQRVRHDKVTFTFTFPHVQEFVLNIVVPDTGDATSWKANLLEMTKKSNEWWLHDSKNIMDTDISICSQGKDIMPTLSNLKVSIWAGLWNIDINQMGVLSQVGSSIKLQEMEGEYQTLQRWGVLS